MNDTLAVKGLITNQIGSTQLDASARSFPRVASNSDDYRRRSTHISSLSPTDIVIQHTPRSTKNLAQRSRIAVEQSLTRLDASSNPISVSKFSVALTMAIPQDVTLAEFREAYRILLGALAENNSALLDAMFNGEY